MAKPQDSERGKGKDAKAGVQGDNVFELFPQGRRRKRKGRTAYATEEELAEYRAMLPRLRLMLKEYDELKRRVERNTKVTSHCVLAKSILEGDTP